MRSASARVDGPGRGPHRSLMTQIESAPKNSLVLIEEIENGLHTVAVRRMVEYLVGVSERRSIQAIFTTHSDYALDPLPPEAIWASTNGRVKQGRISIDDLRAITGRIDERFIIYVEDPFAKRWVESILRVPVESIFEEVGVYFLQGDGNAVSAHLAHQKNPAFQHIKSVCIIDGDSQQIEDFDKGIIKLSGKKPETEIFNFVRENIDMASMRLAVAFHLQSTHEKNVKKAVEEVSLTNRDSRLIFNQVGQKLGFISEEIVSSGFIGYWNSENQSSVDRITSFLNKKFFT